MTELDRFLRRPEVEQTIGVSTTTLYDWIAAGKFPRPIKVGATSRWSAREIAEWQLQKVAERIQPTVSPTTRSRIDAERSERDRKENLDFSKAINR